MRKDPTSDSCPDNNNIFRVVEFSNVLRVLGAPSLCDWMRDERTGSRQWGPPLRLVHIESPTEENRLEVGRWLTGVCLSKVLRHSDRSQIENVIKWRVKKSDPSTKTSVFKDRTSVFRSWSISFSLFTNRRKINPSTSWNYNYFTEIINSSCKCWDFYFW